jgi:3'-5' exoribonuclease
MIIELEMLQAKLTQLPGFPAELKTLLEHLIISHHGQYDFGSPKLPMFPEALMLHYLDDLDSKMEAMRAHFQREAESEGPWTSYNASLGRPLLDSRKFMQGEKAPASPNADDSGTQPATSTAPEPPTSSAPVVDVFSEQKA